MWPAGFDRPATTDIQVFTASQSTDTTEGWQSYTRPDGASWVFILLISSGGGGGMGAGGAATLAPGGGGSGSMTRLMAPAFLLPQRLYIRAGNGGLGATTSGAGGTGTTSYVCVLPNTTQSNIVLSAVGGTGAAGAASFSGGAGAAAVAATAGPFIGNGLFVSVAGQGGTQGSNTTNGAATDITPGTSGLIVTSGAGGGNGTAQGGSCSSAGGSWRLISGGAGTSGTGGRNGFRTNHMIAANLLNMGSDAPMVFSGGSGGGGHSTGAAGGAGSGAYGCGGGGGGNSSGVGGTAGTGGNGGSALIIIMAW